MRTLLLACIFLALPAAAEDLRGVYRDAKASDAAYAAARHALVAGLEKLPQGRALLLPTLNLTATATNTDFRQDFRGDTPLPRVARDFRNQGYALTLTQPIFRMQNWLSYGQAGLQVTQAEATFRLAEQD